MTHSIRTAAASVAAAALLLPAGASAYGGDHGAGAAPGFGQVPARVKAKAKRVDRVLARVEDHANDGEDTAALTSIAVLDKAITAAQKAGVKRVGTDAGPAAVGRVAWADDDVALTTADLLDGASAALSTGLAGSLDKALDSRDALVAAVAALPTADQADYAVVLDRLAEDSTQEADAFTEGAADDELTADAKTALTDAAAQATATAAAASALVADDTAGDSATAGDSGSGAGDCPGGRGGRGGAGRFGGAGGYGSGQQDPQGALSSQE